MRVPSCVCERAGSSAHSLGNRHEAHTFVRRAGGCGGGFSAGVRGELYLPRRFAGRRQARQGKYDIELTLYASPDGGSVVGGPLTMYGVDVTEGSFATEADFGPLAKSFKNAYVGVKVRNAGGGEFVSLGTTPAQVDTNSSCPGSWSLDGNAGNPAGTTSARPTIRR